MFKYNQKALSSLLRSCTHHYNYHHHLHHPTLITLRFTSTDDKIKEINEFEENEISEQNEPLNEDTNTRALNTHQQQKIIQANNNANTNAQLFPVSSLDDDMEMCQNIEFSECTSSNEIMQILWNKQQCLFYSDIVYTNAIDKCMKLGEWKTALRIWSMMDKNGISKNTNSFNVLINGLCLCDRTELAFDKLTQCVSSLKQTNSAHDCENELEPNAETFHLILKGCKQRPSLIEIAEKTWKLMVFECNIAPDVAICNAMIGVYGRYGCKQSAEQLWTYLVKSNCADIETCTEMVNVYTTYAHKTHGKNGNSNGFKGICEFVEKSNLKKTSEYYSAMVQYYLTNRNPKIALQLFEQMRLDLIKINEKLLFQQCLCYLQLKDCETILEVLQAKYPKIWTNNNGNLNRLKFEGCLIKANYERSNGVSGGGAGGECLADKFKQMLLNNELNGYWTHSDENNQWWIDLHGHRPRMVKFILKYIFEFERTYLMNLTQQQMKNVVILCGKGQHSNVQFAGSLKNIVQNELLSWNPPIKTYNNNKCDRNGDPLLVLNNQDVLRFLNKWRSKSPFFGNN